MKAVRVLRITPMSASILCIGTELTRGEIQNTNAAWLADRLAALGIPVRTMEVVPDEQELIVECLQRLGEHSDLIVCTGGLGPTTDDITAETVAQLLNVPLERHAPSLDAINTRLQARGRPMTASNAKQADFPRGSDVLDNPAGTAPGFHVRVGRAEAFFMPGVPREMYRMFETHVVPVARTLVVEEQYQHRIRTFGAPESALNDRLAGVEEEFGVIVGYRAHFPEIEVKLLARGRTERGTAEERSLRAAERVRTLLADIIYAEGDITFAEATILALRARGWTLALAESCTGGLVAHLLTTHSVSDLFVGGAVTYANEAKERMLGVRAETLAAHGAVSPEVAAEMAEGARRTLGADVALSLTGVAGPTGGTPEKPVGLVHYAVATAQRTITKELRATFGERDRIQLAAAYRGLELLRRVASE